MGDVDPAFAQQFLHVSVALSYMDPPTTSRDS
jgi:hypothetical protein